MILSPGNELAYGDWLPAVKQTVNNLHEPLQKLEEVEKNHITEVLKQLNWKVSGEKGAAKFLGLNPTTLEARMKKLGIKRAKLKSADSLPLPIFGNSPRSTILNEPFPKKQSQYFVRFPIHWEFFFARLPESGAL